MENDDLLAKQLAREKNARKQAEAILEKKSAELFNINNELRDKEKHLRAILNATADGIIVFNNKNKVELCNHSACKIFGYEMEKLINLDESQLIVFDSLPLEMKANELFEIMGLRIDGRQIPLELAVSELELSEHVFKIYSFRDISERKESEKRTSVLHQITRILAESDSREEVIPTILEIMCVTLQVDTGAYWEIDNTKEIIKRIYTWSVDSPEIQQFIAKTADIVFKCGEGLPGSVWKTKTSQWITNIKVSTNFSRAALAMLANLKSCYGFPLIVQNEVVGIIEFFTHKVNPLDEALIKMLGDVSKQIEIFIQRENAQKNVDIARLIGMSEVATSVLHNVGNVLNSVNVSADLLVENIAASELKGLIKSADLIEQQKNNLAYFLTEDPKGQHLPAYLISLAQYWKNEQAELITELKSLIKNVQHIKDIIAMQQSLAGTFGIQQLVSFESLIEDSLQIIGTDFSKKGIRLIKNYTNLEPVLVDKVKIMQILINLISNSKDALIESSVLNKKITLNFRKDEVENFLMIEVIDNGIGISNKNKSQIFSHGFTSKKSGHGFGLHASALAAKAMQGSLTFHSDGPEKGTTFTLRIPYKTSAT